MTRPKGDITPGGGHPEKGAPPGGRRGRRTGTLILMGVLFLIGIAGGLALGIWQVERRAWKHDLIARVDARIHQDPVAAPGPDAWSRITRDGDEYRRVALAGRFLNDRETLVRATTDLGAGYWVVTPFADDRGFTVLVNRGFVPPERKDPASRAAGQIETDTRVTGLMRITEPGGGFLRENDPAAEAWYSRDVAAIARARGLAEVAPYFVDAAETAPGGYPVGGLTKVSFPDSHLVYALTWFTLALMSAAGAVSLLRSEIRRRRA